MYDFTYIVQAMQIMESPKNTKVVTAIDLQPVCFILAEHIQLVAGNSDIQS